MTARRLNDLSRCWFEIIEQTERTILELMTVLGQQRTAAVLGLDHPSPAYRPDILGSVFSLKSRA